MGEDDVRLIECERCREVLNGKSFWVKDGTAEIVCERCEAAEVQASKATETGGVS